MHGRLDRLATLLIGGSPREDRQPQVAVARRLAVAALVLGVVLRLGFSVLNLQAYDDHLEVSQAIAYEGRVPVGSEMWEAFQPKLYHAAVAGFLVVLPERHQSTEIRIANFVSCFAGLVTLLVLVRFIYCLRAREQIRYQAIVLLALNPKFILISSQATNDSFVICFCVLALLAGQRWYSSLGWKDWAWLTFFSVLAGLSKGNALVLPCAISLTTLLVVLLSRSQRIAWRPLLVGTALFLIAFVPIVGLLGPYYRNYQNFGTPLITSYSQQPLPHLFKPTYVMRPGVTSIAESFFTFRWFDLLREPTVGYDIDEFNPYRTSVPSLLFARAHSIHFDFYPTDIESDAPFVRTVIRGTLILGLPLTLLMLGEVMRRALTAFVATADQDRKSLLLTVACLGFIGFQVVYAIRYRDFTAIKTIFLFPALPGFVAAYVEGTERLVNQYGESSLVGRIVSACCAWLPALYLADIFSALASLGLARLRAG